jgi:tetratricopeptide (TPR) repeat protein
MPRGRQSFLTRWRKAVQPLPESNQRLIQQKRRQKRLVIVTITLALLIAGGWYAYNYIANAPVRARVEFDKGIALMNPGDYEQAVDQFTRALEIWPDMAEAYLNRGIVLHALGQREAAVADLERALELNSRLARARTELGQIHLENRDQTKALEELTKSIEIEPTTDAYYQRGLLYESLGEHQKAIEDYDKAISERRDSPFAYRARALAKQNLGDMEGARLDREAAANIDGDR